MNPDDRLDALLDDWQEAQARGLALSPKELCGDTPDLLPELSRRVGVLSRFEALRPHVPTVQSRSGEASALPLPEQPTSTFEHQPALTNTMSDARDSQPTPDLPLRPTLPAIDSDFGGYRIRAQLGHGGMGCVFRATETRLKRDVALKVMLPDCANKTDAHERFLREALAMAAVRNDYVVEIYQVGEVNGVPFMAMPLLEGETLAARLKRDNRLPAAEVLRVGREIAEGLAAAHAKGLIHRDIKPANVWLEAGSNRVKLLDFGLVRDERLEEGLTREGAILGTPPYMSPEQVNGEALDARSDLFSVGSVLYECATGRRAFLGSTRTAILTAVGQTQPPAARVVNPSVPVELSDLIDLLLQKTPERRPQSAGNVIERIRSLEVGGPADEDTTALPPHLLSHPGRWWLGLVGLVAVALLGTIGTIFFWKASAKPSVAPDVPGSVETRVEKPPLPSLPALEARLDVRIWKKADVSKALTLGDEGALPLAPGDRMRIEASTNRRAYLYLIYLDADGQASPIFPWTRYDWNNRPEEQKRQGKTVPDDDPKGAKLDNSGASGIEAVLMLACDEPLSARDADHLRQVLDKAPAQGQFDPLRGAVWLGSEERFGKATDRGRPILDVAGKAVDPVERVRRLVRSELKDLAGDVRGVCYPFKKE